MGRNAVYQYRYHYKDHYGRRGLLSQRLAPFDSYIVGHHCQGLTSYVSTNV